MIVVVYLLIGFVLCLLEQLWLAPYWQEVNESHTRAADSNSFRVLLVSTLFLYPVVIVVLAVTVLVYYLIYAAGFAAEALYDFSYSIVGRFRNDSLR